MNILGIKDNILSVEVPVNVTPNVKCSYYLYEISADKAPFQNTPTVALCEEKKQCSSCEEANIDISKISDKSSLSIKLVINDGKQTTEIPRVYENPFQQNNKINMINNVHILIDMFKIYDSKYSFQLVTDIYAKHLLKVNSDKFSELDDYRIKISAQLSADVLTKYGTIANTKSLKLSYPIQSNMDDTIYGHVDVECI